MNVTIVIDDKYVEFEIDNDIMNLFAASYKGKSECAAKAEFIARESRAFIEAALSVDHE